MGNQVDEINWIQFTWSNQLDLFNLINVIWPLKKGNISLKHLKLHENNFKTNLGMPSKKYYLDREIDPISSDTATIGPVSEHLDREYW